MIDQRLADLIREAWGAARKAGELATPAPEAPLVLPPADPKFGDLTTNAALVGAKAEKKPPRKIAEVLAARLAREGMIARVEIAGPGHLNFTLDPAVWRNFLLDLLAIPEEEPLLEAPPEARGKRVLLEYVSANPTGPLHVGHGRGAALGDSLARVLAAAGYDVTREFYVNDAGVQIRTLGESVYARYLQLYGRDVPFLENYYHGDYVREIAEDLRKEHGESLLAGPDAAAFCAETASARLLEELKKDLLDFRVSFDVWSSEKALVDAGAVEAALGEMKAAGEAYERDDALWLRSSARGDEKDRVLVKSDGERTYLAGDVAYHRDKYRRGFHRLVNVWGADHHGYVARVRAAVEAFGYDPKTLDVLLLQLVSLRRGGEAVAMGKRSGVYTSLRDVMEEVGTDAARFFFLTRKADAALDFDLDLAKKHSLDNPVYHVQYVHARIQSVLRKATEEGAWARLFRREEIGEPLRLAIGFAGERREIRVDPACLGALELPEEMALARKAHDFLRVLAGAAAALEPHRLSAYLVELAQQYHSYYTMGNRDRELRIVTEDARRSEARLLLSAAVQYVVRRGLALLGVGAPERM